MRNSITVRDIDPGNKSWLRREARRIGVSMEELIRRLIHEKRAKTARGLMPSEAFARHFGEEHGVELPSPVHRGREPLSFSPEEECPQLAWLIDTNAVHEVMRLRPEPRVADLLDSIADEGPRPLLPSPSGQCPTGTAGSIPAGVKSANRPGSDDDYQMRLRPCG